MQYDLPHNESRHVFAVLTGGEALNTLQSLHYIHYTPFNVSSEVVKPGMRSKPSMPGLTIFSLPLLFRYDTHTHTVFISFGDILNSAGHF